MRTRSHSVDPFKLLAASLPLAAIAASLTLLFSGHASATSDCNDKGNNANAQIQPSNNINVDEVTVANGIRTPSVVTLNGNNSRGTSFVWSQVSGTAVTLSVLNNNPATVSFTVPEVGVLGETLIFDLTATCSSSSNSATVNVNISNILENRAPVAAAAADPPLANEGQTVGLTANGSADPDGDPLTYSWIQTQGPTVQIQNATSKNASFTAPGNVYPDPQLTL